MIHSESSRAAAPANDGVASWYTPGPIDGFGDRLLMFDNSGADSLEMLRFYPSLAAVAGFEESLRERVRQVGQIPDHAFPLIVAVERLEGDGTLALVSTHIPGKRLSVLFDRPGRRGLNPSFVTGMVVQVVKSLTILQSKGHDITHSALTPDRVVVTTNGRVCIVEHVLGSALRQLNLSASQLWSDFGLVTPPDPSGSVHLDARTDVFQLGVLALELLLGRRLTRLDLKGRLPDLLDEWSATAARTGLSSDRLRAWLERTLHTGQDAYQTAADAYADLSDMPAESTAAAFELLTGDVDAAAGRRRLQPPKQPTGRETSTANLSAPAPVLAGAPAPVRAAAPVAAPAVAPVPAPATAPPPPAPIRSSAPAPEPAQTASPALPTASPALPVASPTLPTASPAVARVMAPRTARKVRHVSPWVTAALGLLALVESGVIAALVMRQPAVATIAARAAEPGVPIAGSAPLSTAAPQPAEAAPRAASATSGPRPPATSALNPIAVVNNQRSGGVELQTPIELKVLHGDEVLGSTADGPIIMRAGTYQLDLINTTLGLRMRRDVTFREGQVARMDIALPMGRVSVNAQPWAEVSIDNREYGETPLANLPVALGNHEIVFRHPDLGERRQQITVRADGETRVGATFGR